MPLVEIPPLAFSNFFAINDEVMRCYDAKMNFLTFDGEHDHLNGIADTDHFILSSRLNEHRLSPSRSALRAIRYRL